MEQTLIDISNLTVSQARLLLALVFYGDTLPFTELQAKAGVHGDSYYNACRKLEEAGLLKRRKGASPALTIQPLIPSPISHGTQPGNPKVTGMGNVDVDVDINHGNSFKASEHSDASQSTTGIILANGNKTAYPDTPKAGDTFWIPTPQIMGRWGNGSNGVLADLSQALATLRAKAEEIDRMPDAGAWYDSTSPARKRRDLQLALLAEAWSVYFPGCPVPSEHKLREVLGERYGAVVEVLIIMDNCLTTENWPQEHPLTYLRGAIKRARANEARWAREKINHAPLNQEAPKSSSPSKPDNTPAEAPAQPDSQRRQGVGAELTSEQPTTTDNVPRKLYVGELPEEERHKVMEELRQRFNLPKKS